MRNTKSADNDSLSIHYSRFLTNFSIDKQQWENIGSTVMKTTVLDTKKFDFLEDSSMILKIVVGCKEKHVIRNIGYSGDIQRAEELVATVHSIPNLQEYLSFTTNRTTYKHKLSVSKGRKKRKLTDLLLYHDFVVFPDGDPFLLIELTGDPSELSKHIGSNSRMTVFEGIFRYHPDVYDKMYRLKIIPSPSSKVYESDWNAWDYLPEQTHSNEKEHLLTLRFQGRLFSGKRLMKEREEYAKALVVPEEDLNK
eukprot:NODE_408_length_7975_cov_0.539487.p4 type:complete len:252 gc:universal NODE_408_length_7975_cov_0.539487:166-921(+)